MKFSNQEEPKWSSWTIRWFLALSLSLPRSFFFTKDVLIIFRCLYTCVAVCVCRWQYTRRIKIRLYAWFTDTQAHMMGLLELENPSRARKARNMYIHIFIHIYIHYMDDYIYIHGPVWKANLFTANYNIRDWGGFLVAMHFVYIVWVI